jgi:hypothetical protein
MLKTVFLYVFLIVGIVIGLGAFGHAVRNVLAAINQFRIRRATAGGADHEAQNYWHPSSGSRSER